MTNYLNIVAPPKLKLTTANISKAIEYNIVPKELLEDVYLHLFFKETFNKKNLVCDGVYRLLECFVPYFNRIEHKYINSVKILDNGDKGLVKAIFEPIYKNEIRHLFSWIKSEEALDLFNKSVQKELIDKNCSGSLEKWDMDSLGYYTDKHELTSSNISSMYKLEEYGKLSESPIKEQYLTKLGQPRFRNKLSLIAGVVIEKNRIKSKVTISTEYGVVDLKMSKHMYSEFDRREVGEKSWFERGTQLLISGYRNKNYFFPKVYRDSLFEKEIYKIENKNNKVRILKKDA